MPGVELKGSCHCGTVRFTVNSSSPAPYALCSCSICRKCGGYGGSVNLGGHANSLKVLQGKNAISIYHAVMDRDTPKEHRASSERHFCSKCGSMLWVYDKQWPELIHPFAAAIDSELAVVEEMSICRADSKPAWVRLPEGKKQVYDMYPPDSLEGWHKKHGLWVE
ncbi:Mss4-like protein [Schizophyllum commune]